MDTGPRPVGSSSCGSGRRCVDGDCEGCDTAEACGPTCVACVAPNDICRNGEACVACLSDADCEATQYCTGSWTCADRCFGALGCVSDNAPTGLKCSTAKIVGRKTAVAGTRISGDTTDDGDDDNLPSIGTDCWNSAYWRPQAASNLASSRRARYIMAGRKTASVAAATIAFRASSPIPARSRGR